MDNKNYWLYRFAQVTSLCTFCLIIAGGLVTSHGAGLSVPDWPNTYGYFMFSFPWSKMVGGILYEHSHRMIASFVGFLMVILAYWLWRKEDRRWVRMIGYAALGTVVLQGLLGGLTVLFLLPAWISTSHATLAQTFFGLTACLVLFTSPEWQRDVTPVTDPARPSLRQLTIATTIVIYIQLILGAWMRHTDSGLAIPDFPLAFGQFIPSFASKQIAIHFAHRVGALTVSVFILTTVIRIFRNHRQQTGLVRPAILLLFLLFFQITLGAFTIWSRKDVLITTAHVAVGSLVLVTNLIITIRSFRWVPNPIRIQNPSSDHTPLLSHEVPV